MSFIKDWYHHFAGRAERNRIAWFVVHYLTDVLHEDVNEGIYLQGKRLVPRGRVGDWTKVRYRGKEYGLRIGVEVVEFYDD